VKNIYLDIETVALPVEKRAGGKPDVGDIKLGNLKDPAKIAAKIAETMAEWEAGDGCALRADEGRVALVGIAVDDGPVVSICNEDEGDLLIQVWQIISEAANIMY
jgi:hypothetical protein